MMSRRGPRVRAEGACVDEEDPVRAGACRARHADGVPEQHDNIVDVVIVQSGEGALLLGGKMVNPKAGSGAGEYLGTGIDGAEQRPLGPGDIVHIPPKIPHSFLVPKGKHITYVLVKFPAPK